MRYRQLGRSGVRVSVLCLGTYNFGGATSESDAIRIIYEALDAGINLIDSANIYHAGLSETILGKALRDRRQRALVATKLSKRHGAGPNDWGASRLTIRREVEASLARLGTDWIDLYQVHRPDPTTPIAETLEALNELVRAGLVRYIGTSNYQAWRIVHAHCVAEARSLNPFVCEQPPYSVLERTIETEILPACRHLGIGILPWAPLAGGLLSDRMTHGQRPVDARPVRESTLDRAHWQPTLHALDRLAALARAAGTSLARFSLAWLGGVPGVTAPLIGPRTVEQLRDALASLDFEVPSEMRAAVDEIAPPGCSLWLRPALTDRGAGPTGG